MMKVNGIALTRGHALEAAGIDPHGPMSQFKTVLGADYQPSGEGPGL